MNWLRNYLADSPLSERVYRRFYIGTLGNTMAYAMLTTAAAWLMATLTPSAFMVAMVQTATTAPAMVVGLLAGSLSDIFDRRRVMLVTQAILLTVTLLMAVAQFAGLLGPASLLFFTLVIGIGIVFFMPAQWASISDLVARDKMPAAISLGSVANNAGRSVGPALAGGLTVWFGAGSALLGAAAGFAWMMFAAWRMAPMPSLSKMRETVFSGMFSGVRFMRHSEAMRALNIRTLAFTLCAAAMWALLPLVARDVLKMGAAGFGALLTSFGIGAVVCGLMVPALFKRYAIDAIVVRGSVVWVVAMLLLIATNFIALALLATAVAGAAWVAILSVLATATQGNAPDWVRARALSVNFLSVQGSLAIGAALWGGVADLVGVRYALLISAVAMALLVGLTRRWQIDMGSESGIQPGAPLPELVFAIQPALSDGPVIIQVVYKVSAERRRALMGALLALEPVRRRLGANQWKVFRDLEDADVLIERYIIESWAEYLRLRGRVTVGDREAVERVEALADEAPRFSRLIGVDFQDLLDA